MSSDPKLLSAFSTASVLISSFYRQGIRHAIVSPGSRSTPLTMAAAHHPGLKKQVVLDERSAAFIALGIGKATGVPALLVCTSGTAAVNYMPAVTEARQSGVPMVVCTADRPPYLRGTGSSQTIDQVKLFGDQVVWFHELGEPADTQQEIRRISFAAEQAVRESTRTFGAAHINIPFRKPLEPRPDDLQSSIKMFQKQVSENLPDSTQPAQSCKLPAHILDMLNQSERPLLIAGPSNPFQSVSETILEISESLVAPILAEPGSGISSHPHRITGFEQFLRNPSPLSSLQPDLILRFGDQPFTKSVLTALDKWNEVPLIRFDARNSWQDHQMNSLYIVSLSAGTRLDKEDLVGNTTDDWLDTWHTISDRAALERNDSLKREATLCDGHLFDRIAHSLPHHWNLMLSNSLPVRDAALFGSPESTQFVNRGAAGIDGIVSTALGIAEATKKPTCCVVGDLAFLHDSNALLTLARSEAPVIIMIVNNGGGTIFRMLPVHEQQDIYREYFETPHNPDIGHIAKAHHLPYKRIDTLQKLSAFQFSEHEGPIIIECVTDAGKSMEMRKKLWAAKS